MNKKNIILKTIDEVHFFKQQLLFSIVRNEFKKTFLLLSQNRILDIEPLRNYLIENKLNDFAKKEIDNLINKIDACLDLEKSYRKLPIEDCNYKYEYEGKGCVSGNGGIKFILVVKGSFFKADNKTFDEKEPNFKYIKSFNIGLLVLRLTDIKSLFEMDSKEPELETMEPIKKDLSDTTATESAISEPQQPNRNNNNFDPNHFNQKGYDLFLYLVEHYDKLDKTKFINIFYYLKYYRKENIYFFNFTEDKYKSFVLKNHSVSVNHFKKDKFDNSSEKHVLNSHEQQFDGR
ncbi:hypothetical protein SAMN05444372_10983 [Flavobacterium micromati]|uniref:Uncharacterized protein n=1 Tax=Flavobacterium micromati TaxID=229205 RepID=A0A1M5M8Z6_9FLAO|nr:hypothetical protein [Flavobacterium micromati]SHG73439.1 hypothetical protein SAMN05444372_10983 [Flavobacterium micromati]